MIDAGSVAVGTHRRAPPEEPALTADEKAYGFWLYLMSDLVLFALLFATFAVMRGATAGGPDAHALFDLKRSFAETVALLTSSFLFGVATVRARQKRTALTLTWLAGAAALGAVFLWLEASEFAGFLAVGAGPRRSGFLSAFFTLVGAHGLHVSMGMIWIGVMMAQIGVKGLNVQVVSRLSRLGAFWHFLDIVWIGIFSVIYLPAVAA